jgi:all-trans-retinol dehydrogenase (NAD+)
MKELHEKIVLITGAGMGLGRLLALKFADEGSRVVLWDLNEAAVRKTVGEVLEKGGQAWWYVCDVSDRLQVYETAARVRSEAGKVDVLVNNAGIVAGKDFLECSDEELQRTLEVNTMAHFWTSKAFLPDMIAANSGHIVAVSSVAGWVGVARMTDYTASKFAATGFMESLGAEMRKAGYSGIQTTTICPFFVDTGMFDGVRSRFKFLLPILSPEKVVQKSIRAVKNGKRILLLPWIVNAIPLLRLFPAFVMDMVLRLLGMNAAMDGFRGRSQVKPEVIPDMEMGKPTENHAAIQHSGTHKSRAKPG